MFSKGQLILSNETLLVHYKPVRLFIPLSVRRDFKETDPFFQLTHGIHESRMVGERVGGRSADVERLWIYNEK